MRACMCTRLCASVVLYARETEKSQKEKSVLNSRDTVQI